MSDYLQSQIIPYVRTGYLFRRDYGKLVEPNKSKKHLARKKKNIEVPPKGIFYKKIILLMS